jgi:hypothetical protein
MLTRTGKLDWEPATFALSMVMFFRYSHPQLGYQAGFGGVMFFGAGVAVGTGVQGAGSSLATE